MHLYLSIPTNQIPANTDPILDLVSILEREGFKLVQNGVLELERFLVFEFPVKDD